MRLRLIVPADVDTPTGGNVYDLALADALRRDGDDVEVVRTDPADLPAVLSQPWPGQTLVDGMLACPQPRVVAAARACIVVHMPIALETGLTPGRSAELDALERQALEAAPVVLATSHWSADYIARRHGIDHVAVAAPGVDPAPVSTGSTPPLLVHLAALLPHKDQLGVVEALRRVQDLPWRARLAGAADRDPEYAAAVKAAVITADLTTRIEIPGTMARGAAWVGADLALLPSRVETFGMVVTEALARGIPAVVSRGGAAEALGVAADGERPGMVIPAGEPDVLAQVLRQWLTDKGYRDRLRARALSRRSTLEGWEVTAHRVRVALASGC